MSKAFTKETDSEEEGLREDAPPSLEGRNYMTPGGYEALQRERRHLVNEDRPRVVEIVSWAAGNGDRSENGDYIYGKRRLREIDRRIRFLTKRLESACVVDPACQTNRSQVFFGATVTVAYEDGTRRTIRIVGVDEADLAMGQVSLQSPIACALIGAKEGDLATVRTPTGPEEIEIVRICYDTPGSPA